MHMTHYEKMIVAIRHGVTVRSATMQYLADVTFLTTRPHEGRVEFSVTPIEAENEYDAARQAAAHAAEQAWPHGQGAVGFINGCGGGVFRACVGLYQPSALGGVTYGTSVSIKVMRWAEAGRA